MPYEPHVPLASQIHTSLASSLENLRPREDLASIRETYIDCLVLHSPLDTIQDTLAAWNLFESYVPQKVRRLGISNTDTATLKTIYDESRIKPAVVQNRFYARTGYDVDIRAFCREHNIVYESFWTLTGNPNLLKSAPVALLSKDAGVSRELALYALVMSLGIAPLNGTTNTEHMKQDLEDIMRIRNWTFVYSAKWASIVAEFKHLVGDE
jgi:diketogulonate reductase-like aldo/keto reductase